MKQLNDRTRRGLAEAIGIPSAIGALALALMILARLFGAVT